MRSVAIEESFDMWRDTARQLLAREVNPEDLLWQPASQPSLFAIDLKKNGLSFHGAKFSSANNPNGSLKHIQGVKDFRVPTEFFTLVKNASHTDGSEKWAFFYRIAWRLIHEDPNLLQKSLDADIKELRRLSNAVDRDFHRLCAFLRFKKVEVEVGKNAVGEHFIAWYVPTFDILKLAAPFFANRFGNSPWTIFTPRSTAVWDTKSLKFRSLKFRPGLKLAAPPTDEKLEEIWREHQLSAKVVIFKRMSAAETISSVIPVLARNNEELIYEKLNYKEKEHNNDSRTAPSIKSFHLRICDRSTRLLLFGPSSPSLLELRRDLVELGLHRSIAKASRAKSGSPKVKELNGGTASVDNSNLGLLNAQFLSEGNIPADVLIIGSQPGNKNEKDGKPFKGATDILLSEALRGALIPRSTIHITDAGKHFRGTERSSGTRLAGGPHRTKAEVAAYTLLLDAKLEQIKPKLIVCLGSAAATAVLGRKVRVKTERGRLLTGPRGRKVLVSFDPSAILRMALEGDKRKAFEELVEDLKTAARLTRENNNTPEIRNRSAA